MQSSSVRPSEIQPGNLLGNEVRFENNNGDIDMLPDFIPGSYRERFPNTLTLLVTFKCNAACADCCFECNPSRPGRLSLGTMMDRIDQAVDQFPGLRLVVFTGGECFLIKDDLFRAIEHAHKHGLLTRCVTNAFWGKSPEACRRTVEKLKDAGVDEINISTGLDHQEWVPADSVIRAAKTLVTNNIFTLVTVEKDTADSTCMQQLTVDESIRDLIKQRRLFRLICNTWMPFRQDSADRSGATDRAALESGCKQIFYNALVTPSDQLSACCGLTFEHIPEMNLGQLGDGDGIARLYYAQFADFLKIWIHLDGPYTIMTRLFGEEVKKDLHGVDHICQACVILHQHPEVRRSLRDRYREFVPDVMNRFFLQRSMEQKMEVSAENLTTIESKGYGDAT